MLSAARTALSRRCLLSTRPSAPPVRQYARFLSSTAADNFTPSPPNPLTVDMAEGIATTTRFYMRHGISHQQLQNLSRDDDIPAVQKWQKMMEIYLMTQVHVIAAMGYPANEEGLGQYAQDLGQCIQKCDETMIELLTDMRRSTWRELVATAFQLEADDIPSLEIVEARNLMHKVASKMMEPDILLEIQTKASKIENENPEMEVALKHQVLQNVIVHSVYLGGNPSLVEEAGFGSGPQAYAKIQCAMSDFEGDPLVAEYASSAMVKIWQAAGLDISGIQPAGAARSS